MAAAHLAIRQLRALRSGVLGAVGSVGYRPAVMPLAILDIPLVPLPLKKLE
jgi:hypothetical protein